MAEEAANTGNGGGSSTKLVLIMIVGAIVLVAVSMGGIFFLLKSMGMLNQGGGGNQQVVVVQEAPKPAIYHPLEPAFVVNYKERGRTRFLQAQVEVMTRDPKVVEALTKHMPLIRNNLLLLLSAQTAEILHSAEGKEQIRQQAQEEVNRILKEETGTEGVEAVYFTSFVMQ